MSQRDTTHSVDDDLDALELLELRLQALLPEEYEDTYQSLEATPMRSAPLAYDEAGRVAWDVIWGGFCDLALAGGPPHKGSLLRPGSQVEIEENRDQYHRVTAEICRGITMATNLAAREAATAGWVQVDCPDELTASWLLRAIVVENVAVRHHGTSILLPAAPGFRLEKEIKNVVTVVAKTVHYWTGHMTGLKRWTIARVLADIDSESPLVVPAQIESDSDRLRLQEAAGRLVASAQAASGLQAICGGDDPWVGIACPSQRLALWMMRVLVVSNVLSRREGTTLYVPINPERDESGAIVSRAVARARRFAGIRGVS